MELLMTIISLIIGIFFILNAIVTNKEAAKFISDPYAYNNEKYGDGYRIGYKRRRECLVGCL
jgi:hypothetical protein